MTLRLTALLLLLLLLPAAPAGAGDACCPSTAVKADPHTDHDHAEEGGHAGEPASGHGKDDGHGHGAKGPGPIHALPFAEVAALECEHKVKTVDCANCRFEVGVVRIDPGSRIFAFERPKPADARRDALDLPGEIRLAADGVRVIASRVPARLLSLAVRVGDPVAKGEPLAELESSELAQAALDFMKRSAELSFAERRARRDAPLAEKRMITDQEYLDGRSAFELASLEVRLARKRLLMLGLENAEIDRLPAERDHPALIGRFTLKSPISGRVTARGCDVGELVPTDHALLTLADLTRSWIVAQCHERDIAALRAALAAGLATVEITVQAAPGRAFTGRIFALDPALARETRTLPVWIETDNTEGLLAAGMFCRVSVPLAGATGGLSLPAEAVLEDEGRAFVFVRARGDLVMSRIVTARPLPGGRMAVEGVPPDAEIVTTGAFLLKSDVLREKMGAGCAD